MRTISSRPKAAAVVILASALLGAMVGCSSASRRHPALGDGAKAAWPAERALTRLPLQLCQREGIEEPLLCGTLEVPLDRSRPKGPQIGIFVLVIPAAEEPVKSAWAEHQGGPGFSSLDVAKLMTLGGPLEEVRAHRDVLLFDQRGVGASGGLYCEALKPNPFLRKRFPTELVDACRKELAGIDLEHYSTSEAVDDLEAIRAWLGYEQLNVAGWSYGSRFMLTYMQRYPERVRTATLVAPTTIDYRRPLDWARFGEGAFEGLVAECRQSPECNAAFPDPEGDLRLLIKRLETSPIEHRFNHPETGERTLGRIDRAMLSEILWQTLLDTGEARQLLWWIHSAAQGNPEPLLSSQVPETPEELWSEPTYLSVVCPEEVAHIEEEEITDAVAGTVIGRDYLDQWIEACRLWNLPPAPATPAQPIELSIPTFVTTGALDPVALPEYGHRIAGHLPNSLHVTIDGRGHYGGDMTNPQCHLNLILQFVEQGNVQGLDTSCLEGMKPPAFSTGP